MLQSIMLDLCWCEDSNLSSGLKCHHIVSVSQNFKTLLDMSRVIGAFINLTNSIYSPAERI